MLWVLQQQHVESNVNGRGPNTGVANNNETTRHRPAQRAENMHALPPSRRCKSRISSLICLCRCGCPNKPKQEHYSAAYKQMLPKQPPGWCFRKVCRGSLGSLAGLQQALLTLDVQNHARQGNKAHLADNTCCVAELPALHDDGLQGTRATEVSTRHSARCSGHQKPISIQLFLPVTMPTVGVMLFVLCCCSLFSGFD